MYTLPPTFKKCAKVQQVGHSGNVGEIHQITEPIVLVIFNPKSTRAFGREKNKVASAGGFVTFWRFSQKHALFQRLPLRARASTARGTPWAFKSTH
jgi:hypothetical protein